MKTKVWNPKSAKLAVYSRWEKERGLKFTIFIKPVKNGKQASITFRGKNYKGNTGADTREASANGFIVVDKLISKLK